MLVIAELSEAGVKREFWELLTLADQLGDSMAGGFRVLACGAGLEQAPEELLTCGATEVHLAIGDGLSEPWAEAHAIAALQVVRQVAPEAVLVPPTLLGTEVAARLALALDAPLLQGMTRLTVDGGGRLSGERVVFGGAALASVTADTGPFVVVPRAGAHAPSAPDGDAIAPVVRHVVDTFGQARVRCTGWIRHPGARDIRAADVVVAGGNGIGSAEGFTLLAEIADALGGVVAASRPPCDAGWVDPGIQVGLTGKTVAPQLYLAVGISGAVQHLMGCSGAKVVVAVNTDKSAPIFRHAHLGVVGDWKDVMTGLLAGLQKG